MFGRSRWAAFGALVAVLLGGGVVLTASAAGSSNASSFVPITPCRLLDTRPSGQVGPRGTPLGAETYTATVWGTNGNCTIPAGATGFSLNVVVINPTAASFLTVFPADATRPLASSLNWVAGQPPTPNAVTVASSGDGKISFYNLSGNVDLAVDIVGYYELSTSGPAGPPGPPGAKGDTGDPGPRPAQVVWVAKSGGDFTSITAALASITDNSASKSYVIKVAPGSYLEPGGIDMKDYVDLVGSGRGVTTITAPGGTGSANDSVAIRATSSVLHTEIRDLSIRTSGAPAQVAIGVFVDTVVTGQVVLRDVSIVPTATSLGIGVLAGFSNTQIVDSEIDAVGPVGIGVQAVASPTTIRGSTIDGSTTSVDSNNGSTVNVLATQLLAPVSGATFHCVAVTDSAFAALNAVCTP